MKADQTTQSQVVHCFKGMFEAYKKKDLQGVLGFWAPDQDITVIGTGEDEKCCGAIKYTENLLRDWEQADITSIGVKDFTVSAALPVAWLNADLTMNFQVGGKDQSITGRLTGVMEKRNGKFMWTQMHYSVPNVSQKKGQSWPKRK
jgi:ketosteroid isomerase-like protein